MKRHRTLLVVIVLHVLVVTLTKRSLFVVDEMHLAVVTRRGIVERAILDSGLHIRIPFAQKVHRLPRQILRWRGAPGELVTRDETHLWARTSARWRIIDPKTFYEKLRTEDRARAMLGDRIDSAARDVIAGHGLLELVRGSNRQLAHTPREPKASVKSPEEVHLGREGICDAILAAARGVREGGLLQSAYGIELIDVQISPVVPSGP